MPSILVIFVFHSKQQWISGAFGPSRLNYPCLTGQCVVFSLIIVLSLYRWCACGQIRYGTNVRTLHTVFVLTPLFMFCLLLNMPMTPVCHCTTVFSKQQLGLFALLHPEATTMYSCLQLHVMKLLVCLLMMHMHGQASPACRSVDLASRGSFRHAINKSPSGTHEVVRPSSIFRAWQGLAVDLCCTTRSIAKVFWAEFQCSPLCATYPCALITVNCTVAVLGNFLHAFHLLVVDLNVSLSLQDRPVMFCPEPSRKFLLSVIRWESMVLCVVGYHWAGPQHAHCHNRFASGSGSTVNQM